MATTQAQHYPLQPTSRPAAHSTQYPCSAAPPLPTPVSFAVAMARRRKSEEIEPADLLLYLERTWWVDLNLVCICLLLLEGAEWPRSAPDQGQDNCVCPDLLLYLERTWRADLV